MILSLPSITRRTGFAVSSFTPRRHYIIRRVMTPPVVFWRLIRLSPRRFFTLFAALRHIASDFRHTSAEDYRPKTRHIYITDNIFAAGDIF